MRLSSNRLSSQLVVGLAILALAAVGCGSKAASPAIVATVAAAAPPPPPPLIDPAAEPVPVQAPTALSPPVDPAGPAAAPEAAAGEPAPQPPESAPAAPPAEAENPPVDPNAVAAAEPQDAGAPPVARKPGPLKGVFPYKFQAPMPEFPENMPWLNTKPLTMKELRGKFVLLDFWTFCCINCMHILPELKKLEHEFPNNLVVIGVHSAKFENEKPTENIREAILRNEIEHPVVNDADHGIWNSLGIRSWPTAVLIDPLGNAVWFTQGEFKAEVVRAEINRGIAYYRDNKALDERRPKFALEAAKERPTPLSFPGKILADEKGQRLFISDSNHNRIVIASLEGKLIDVIGSGEIGRADGDFKSATFNHPQGCALAGTTLYVADTENHMLRKVDLQKGTVTTISGTGEQGSGWPGLDPNKAAIGKDELPARWVGPPTTTPLNSPWALWVHKQDLYIAMAGPHQIWKMPLDEHEIGPYAGNSREDIENGPLLPRVPYMAGFASFAQPSGLTSDGTWLYVADSEGSSIRAVPFDPTKRVRTVLGSDHLDVGRLFAFGDKDGPRNTAKLQHCLEVVYVGPPASGKIYVADTYNHKIKVVEAKNGDTKTLAGNGQPGSGDSPAQFREPAGLAHAAGKLYVADTNNHLIRVIELAGGKVSTLPIAGLEPPAKGQPMTGGGGGGEAEQFPAPKKPSFKNAKQEKVAAASVQPVNGAVKLDVQLKIPAGWHINAEAPMAFWVDSPRDAGAADRAAFGRTKVAMPAARFEVPVKIAGTGDDEVQVSLDYYYCEDKPDGVCKVGSVVFTVPLKIAADGSKEAVKLTHVIAD